MNAQTITTRKTRRAPLGLAAIGAAALMIMSPTAAHAAEVLPVPAIVTPAAGGLVSAGDPVVLSGDGALDGASVTVSQTNGVVVCTTTAQADGSWACDPIAPGTLAVGHYNVSVAQALGADTSPASANSLFSYGFDPVVITSPLPGTLDTNPPIVTGTATPNNRISIRWIGQPFAENIFVTTDDTGAFSAQFDTAIPAGPQRIQVTEFLSGTVGGSRSVSEIIDVLVPGIPVTIDTPAENESTSPTPEFTGAGDEGSTITLTELDGTTLGTAIVTGGLWSFTPTTELPSGSHTVTATQSIDGTTATVTFTVGAPSTITPVTITSPAAGSIVTARPAISGAGEPGATVTISTAAGLVLGTTTVVDGIWTFTPTADLPTGPISLVATQDADDSVASVDLTVQATPVVTPIDEDGTSASKPAELSSTGSDALPLGLVALAATVLGLGLTLLRRRGTVS